MQSIWPNSVQTSGFNWGLLLNPDKTCQGPMTIESQYLRLNIQPTERYVLSVKGSTKYRLPAGKNGYSNLVITGDWIANSVLNAGCVESTVVSGIEAAKCFY